MALLRKLFYRKPPEGLLEISERIYVFNCCFTTDAWEEENYKEYIGGIIGQLQEHFPDAQLLMFNFRDERTKSMMADALCKYDITIMDYPRHYEGCPLLTMELIHHFLRSTESWLSLGQQNVLIMHCERGGWPVLAFMLAALLIYRKQYNGEQKTLDMIYRQAPRELLQLLSPLNPVPSQLRYLQYVSRRNVVTDWPPLDRALTLDCVILRFIPNFDGEGGCRPMFRIYGQDPLVVNDRSTKLLYSTPKKSKALRSYKQGECELVKIDVNCHIQGDIVLECISLNGDMEREAMMFRVVFNTAFIRSNILMLNRDEVDIWWDAKDLYPKEFRVEILFSDTDAAASVVPLNISCFEEKGGLPIEAFAKVHEIFSQVDWLDQRADFAFNVLQQINASNIIHEMSDSDSPASAEISSLLQELSPKHFQDKMRQLVEEDGTKSSLSLAKETHCVPSSIVSPDINHIREKKGTSPEVSPDIDQNKAKKELSQSLSPDTGRSKENKELYTDQSRENKELQDSGDALGVPGQSDVMSQKTPKSSHTELSTSVHNSSLSAPEHHGSSQATIDKPLLDDHASFVSAEVTIDKPPMPRLKHKADTVGPPSPPPPPVPPLQDKSAAGPRRPQPPPVPPSRDKSAAGPPRAPPPPVPPSRDKSAAGPPPPPPPPFPPSQDKSAAGPPPPPPPPLSSRTSTGSTTSSPAAPPAPPPPTLTSNSSPVPSAPPSAKGRMSHTITSRSHQTKQLKPYHWVKLTRAVQGSLWAEAQKSGEASKAPEIDMSELESLFSASVSNSDHGGKSRVRGTRAPKEEKVQLIEHRRAYNCEIMLSKVKVPLPDLMSYVLDMDESVIDIDLVENLIKFCPTKEEIKQLKGYTGDKEKLGKCEQFFMELMKVPRVESKLGVFSFKMQFHSQVSDLRRSLNVVNSAAEQIRNTAKLRRIMQTILSLGNALNQGTARGAAVGFRLDSLPKLNDTHTRDKKMTLMHYLCKVLADKLPELLDFSKDLASLEPATKIHLKFLAEEMQAISKGLEKVVHELSLSENDGPVSENFRKILKEFLRLAEAEVRTLASLYSTVGRNVDALINYFGEDPTCCSFEQVISTLLNFVGMFNKAHRENCKQLELEMKKMAESEKSKMNVSHKESKYTSHTPIKSSDIS